MGTSLIDLKQIISELNDNIVHDKQALFMHLVESRLDKCLVTYHKALQRAYTSLEIRSVTNPVRETRRIWRI